MISAMDRQATGKATEQGDGEFPMEHFRQLCARFVSEHYTAEELARSHTVRIGLWDDGCGVGSDVVIIGGSLDEQLCHDLTIRIPDNVPAAARAAIRLAMDLQKLRQRLDEIEGFDTECEEADENMRSAHMSLSDIVTNDILRTGNPSAREEDEPAELDQAAG